MTQHFTHALKGKYGGKGEIKFVLEGVPLASRNRSSDSQLLKNQAFDYL